MKTRRIEHCHHEGFTIEASEQDTFDDTGRRRVSISLRCNKCKRLAIFCGVPEGNAGAEGPVAHTAARVLSLPFEMSGSIM